MIIRVRYRRSFCRAGSVVGGAVHEVGGSFSLFARAVAAVAPRILKSPAHMSGGAYGCGESAGPRLIRPYWRRKPASVRTSPWCNAFNWFLSADTRCSTCACNRSMTAEAQFCANLSAPPKSFAVCR